MTRRRGIALGALVAATAVIAGAAIVFASLQPPVALGTPHFVNEATTADVRQVYDGDFEYFVGGGVAAFDCNTDGRPDLYIAGGTNPAALYYNDGTAGGPLRFIHRTDAVTDLTGVVGAYPLDVDGDGITDLFVLRHGENVLLRGLGNCQFERANEQWGFDGTNVWSSAFSATWERGATWPTIAVGSYRDESKNPPANLCFDNQLYRPQAYAAGFGPPTVLSPSWCALSMLFSSWDRSGRADLRVSNDRHYYDPYSGGEEQLWRVAPGEAPRLYTAADGWTQMQIWGMGIASYDITGDGYPDYYLTSQGDNKLQTLAGSPAQPNFMDMALKAGVTATRPYAGDTALPSTSWNPVFADLNNDGLVDLFVTKGNVETEADYAMQDPNDLFLGQPDGTFTDTASEAGLMSFARGRGALAVDLNADGLLDLVVVNRRESVALWRNVGGGDATQPEPQGNWLEVSVGAPNRATVGAWVEVRVGTRTMSREITIGGGQASGMIGPLHFGLGSASSAQVRVTWPDGKVSDWQTFKANQVVQFDTGVLP